MMFHLRIKDTSRSAPISHPEPKSCWLISRRRRLHTISQIAGGRMGDGVIVWDLRRHVGVLKVIIENQ